MKEIEGLIKKIFQNTVHLITTAVSLYNLGKHEHGFFFIITAQEELAKLIIIPIAHELGEIEKIKKDKSHHYYNHSIKQKLFSTYGLQNWKWEKTQSVKEKCMYVEIEGDKRDYKISPETLQREIEKSIDAIVVLLVQIEAEKSFSRATVHEIKIILLDIHQACKTMIPLMPWLTRRLIFEKIKSATAQESLDYFAPKIVSSPYLLIKFLKSEFPNEYKAHLKQIQKMSEMDAVVYILELMLKHLDQDIIKQVDDEVGMPLRDLLERIEKTKINKSL